jgi:hypothetical protein
MHLSCACCGRVANAAEERATNQSLQRLCLQIMMAIGEGNYSTMTVLRALATAAAAEIAEVASMPHTGSCDLSTEAMVARVAGTLHTRTKDMACRLALESGGAGQKPN